MVLMADLHPYESTIVWLRAQWQRVPTPTGKPKYGPSWFAVTECDDGCGRGLTDITVGTGRRWACNTCLGFASPVGFEGKERYFMDEEEALAEYGKWRAKQGLKSQFHSIRTRLRLFV